MWPSVVVESDPVSNGSHRVRLALKAMAMHALLFECPDHTLDHPVLLRTMRRDELLLQPIATNQTCIMAAGKNEPIIRAKQKRAGDFPE